MNVADDDDDDDEKMKTNMNLKERRKKKKLSQPIQMRCMCKSIRLKNTRFSSTNIHIHQKCDDKKRSNGKRMLEYKQQKEKKKIVIYNSCQMHSQTCKMNRNYEALAFVNNSFSPGQRMCQR